MCRFHLNTTPFYKRDLSIHRIWCLVGCLWTNPLWLLSSLVAQMVKNLPAVQETQVWSLSWENPLEKGIATHSTILQRRQWQPTPILLPGKSHGCRSLVGCSPCGREEADMTERLHFHFSFSYRRRKWQPTPVFLPGEPQGRQSLVGCYLWGGTESDATEVT